MEDQLDEELKNRIKKVFDEYQDPSADEGWLQLRKKFPAEKGRRRIVPLFWWSAAALVLLALGLGIWKYSANEQSPNVAGINKIKPVKQGNLQAIKPAPVKVDQTTAQSRKNSAKSATAAASAQNSMAANRARLLPVIPFTPTSVNTVAANTDTSGKKSNTVLASAAKTGTNVVAANQTAVKKTDSAGNTISQTPQNQIAAVEPKTQPAQQAGVKSAAQPNPAATMLADNKAAVKKVSDLGPRVRLGVYAASFVNYAKGSTNQTNAGAGFSAEIRIARNLKLVTGLTLAKNSLNYNGGVPTNAVQSNLFTPSALGIGNQLASAASYNAHAAVTLASAPAFQNYGVSMFNIDVPVDLKYDFNLKKTSFYLMAGLSSGTFANETYTYYYNYPALASPSLQAPHSVSSQRNFDNFYFGKMLNVAFGYGYPLGRNHIILEPFVKLPLGGVGAQNIRLGTGGINLKLNFPTR